MEIMIRSEAFAHFHAVAVKTSVICGVGCLGCQDECFANIPLMAKKMMIMLFTLLFICIAFFGLVEFELSVYGSCFLPRTLV
jgi:hypothetical protein